VQVAVAAERLRPGDDVVGPNAAAVAAMNVAAMGLVAMDLATMGLGVVVHESFPERFSDRTDRR
jgi:hypothetical protein